MSFVDKIYVINLKKRPEKKERILNLILSEGLGIPVEFTEAFDLRRVDYSLIKYWLNEQGFNIYPNWKVSEGQNEEFEGFNFSQWDTREITKGEIGCFLSHYYLWKKVANSTKRCLILEDDAYWEKGKFKEFLLSCSDSAPNFDILYLGRNIVSKKKESPIGDSDVFVKPKFSFNAHAYVLTPLGASSVLSQNPEKNIIPADELLPACWTKHRRSDISNLFKPSLNAVATNKSVFEIWQQGNQDGYTSDTLQTESFFPFNINLSCFTVADNADNEGLKKHICSASSYIANIEVLGLKEKWEGGDMINDPGGGQKINLLIPEIKKLKDDSNSIVLFVDGFDIIFTGPVTSIVERFLSSGKRIIFGAEKTCWPDSSLSDQYPESPFEYKYLNSGSFIGYASDIWSILEKARNSSISNIQDDQLYYTEEFLTGKYKDLISLDYSCEIFQCLAFSYEDISIKSKSIFNNITKTRPLIAHGNAGKEKFWKLSNYIGSEWTSQFPHSPVGVNKKDLKILISIYCLEGMPLERWPKFFKNISKLSYDKSLIYIHIQAPIDKIDLIQSCIKVEDYADVLFTDTSNAEESKTRNESINIFLDKGLDLFFLVENTCLLENSDTINHLIYSDKDAVAPVLPEIIKGELSIKSNFWGATNNQGSYLRSDDYIDIVERKIKGCWTVPFIGSCYLIKRKVFLKNSRPYIKENITDRSDADIAFMRNLTYSRVLFHADNRFDYGRMTWTY